MESACGIRVSFDEAIMQAASDCKKLTEIVAAIAIDVFVIKPIAKFAAETVKKEAAVGERSDPNFTLASSVGT